jgi:hypothetical protein
MTLTPEETPFKERAEKVLSIAFGGLHNIKRERIHWYYLLTENECCEYNTYEELATYDGDILTRLVVSAHDECVRVAISASTPSMVKIQIWPRHLRNGGRMWERHPTMEQAIEKIRSGK